MVATVASHVRDRPLSQGISVRPSGRLIAVTTKRPEGSILRDWNYYYYYYYHHHHHHASSSSLGLLLCNRAHSTMFTISTQYNINLIKIAFKTRIRPNHSALHAVAATRPNTLGFCLTSLFSRDHSRLCLVVPLTSQRRKEGPLGIAGARLFTDRMPFLSPNQYRQCTGSPIHSTTCSMIVVFVDLFARCFAET